jgi:hypothetical protein
MSRGGLGQWISPQSRLRPTYIKSYSAREATSAKDTEITEGRQILKLREFQGYRLLGAEYLKWTEWTEVDVVDQVERFSSREDPPGSWILAPGSFQFSGAWTMRAVFEPREIRSPSLSSIGVFAEISLPLTMVPFVDSRSTRKA